MTNLSQKDILSFGLYTNNYLKSLTTKKNTWENIKADMRKKGLKAKEYIHYIGRWEEYLSFLTKYESQTCCFLRLPVDTMKF